LREQPETEQPAYKVEARECSSALRGRSPPVSLRSSALVADPRSRTTQNLLESRVHTLGINAAFHDPAACLVADGEVIAAAEEERFSRIKHGKRPVPFSTWELPFNAVDFCLKHAGINLVDVDHVVYSFDPFLLLPERMRAQATIELPLEPSAHPSSEECESPWDPLFLSSIVNAPRHLASGAPHHLRARFAGAGDHSYSWHFVNHHVAHAVSAFHASPFRHAAVMTLDGRGERATTSYSLGSENELQLLAEVDYPHSLGILYEQVTSYLGFLHSSDEYKVMALASFGKPAYVREFRDMIRLDSNGRYTIAASDFESLWGPTRAKGGPLAQRHYDIAHSLQVVLEETVLQISDWLHEATQAENLCMAGGVALNCVANGRLLREGPFDDLWIQPAAGDAGGRLDPDVLELPLA